MNFLDLFSGIGGFALAAKNAGLSFEHHFHSEIDEFCNTIYAQHYPEAKQLGSIVDIDGHKLKEQYGKEWILCGGFPCQSVSSAGKRRGFEDKNKSGLWHHYARLIEEIRPQMCLIENVRGLFSMGFTRVLQDLASSGYDAEWRTIRACDYALPHNRQRVWIVAYPKGNGCRTNTEPYKASRDVATSPELDSPDHRLVLSIARQRANPRTEIHGEPLLHGRDDGLSQELYKGSKARVKALGNSICPIIAEDIFRRWKEVSGKMV